MSVADTANSIYYEGYTYSIGDLITLKDRKLYKDSYGPSYITVDGDYVWRINQIYPTQEVKIFVKYESGSDYYQGYSGFVYPSQIASGGTPDKHTVSYNANGGTGAPSSQTKVYGSILTLSSTKPTRIGHTFQGWGTSASDTTVDYAAGGQYGLDQDITLYAIWKANEYTVAYKPNGGTGSDVTQTVTYGKSWTSKGAIFSLTGHTQTSWNTKANGTGVTYSLNTDQTNTQLSDLTLYAIYSANSYDLTVDPNGGNWSGSPNSQYFNQKYGSTKRIADPVRVGYVFKEWSLSGYGSIEDGVYTFGAGDGVLVAQWERIVLTVTFDSETNGGSSNTKRSVYYGDTVGSLPVPKKPYYKFVGWFTKAVGGTQISASQVITTDVTYYAQFKIDASVKIGQNGEKTPAIVWVGQNGVWSKVVAWLGEKGIWNKSTGAD